MKHQQLITIWYDGDIIAGTEWKQETRDSLAKAQVILLLVSADFVASDFCYSNEVALAIDRFDKNEARVIPTTISDGRKPIPV